jgi:1,4-dihydroxy-2-naphthoate octaprenyltransferase
MSRPDQLLLVAGVYALGATIAVAGGADPAPGAGIAGLVALLPVAASIHYANEYADYHADLLTVRTPFSGGSGALPQTGLSRRLALQAAVATLVTGVVVAVWCLGHGLGVTSLALLGTGAALGWGYSVGPRLAWHGLGELDNAVLGGLLLPLYGFAVQTGRVTVDAALACVPFAAVVFCNLLATQWPDRQADAAVGKRTLATRLSARHLRGLYLAGGALYLGSLFALAGAALPVVVVAASLLVAPLVAWGGVTLGRRRSPFPAVAAMVALAALQWAAWAWVAYSA